MQNRSVFFIALIAGLSFLAIPAHAADTQEKLHKVENELGTQKEHAAELDRAAHDTAANLKDLRQRLISATEAVQVKAAEQERLEDKLADLEEDIAAKKSARAEGRKKLDGLMRAFIELGRQPPQSLFMQTQLTEDYIHRAILVRALMPRLRDEAQDIAQDLSDFAEERAKVKAQKHLVQQAQENLQAQRHNLDQLIAARQGMLDRTEEQKAEIQKQLIALTSEAQDLRQLLEKVTPKRAQASLVPHALHGSLRAPVVGRLIHGFGDKDADGVTSQGLTYSAPPGSPVVAPAGGRVVFAGPFKGYGNILILQHDGGYHSFLAGFGRIDADMGQDVEAGEPLGVLPVKDGARPELYFEWRSNTEPVNPGIAGR